MTTFSRPLPLELHEEIHKCLPLTNAIHILVNVSSQAFVDINKPRMLRNIQQIKTSLNEYIDTLVAEEQEYEEEEDDLVKLMFENDLEWKPQLDLLFRYGTWLTSFREFSMVNDNIIEGMPKNFVEELLLHMAYSSFTHLMLHCVKMNFGRDELPIPTFINPLLNKKKEHYRIGSRILFETVELEDEDGQIIQIFDGECEEYQAFTELRLFLVNKMDGKNWFQFSNSDSSGSFEEIHSIFGILKMEHAENFIAYFEINVANGPTNGAYLFDVEVQFVREGSKFVRGIKIQKRKVDDNIEMKCDEQIGQGKKRKAANNDEGEEDEDGPSCSNKLMKK